MAKVPKEQLRVPLSEEQHAVVAIAARHHGLAKTAWARMTMMAAAGALSPTLAERIQADPKQARTTRPVKRRRLPSGIPIETVSRETIDAEAADIAQLVRSLTRCERCSNPLAPEDGDSLCAQCLFVEQGPGGKLAQGSPTEAPKPPENIETGSACAEAPAALPVDRHSIVRIVHMGKSLEVPVAAAPDATPIAEIPNGAKLELVDDAVKLPSEVVLINPPAPDEQPSTVEQVPSPAADPAPYGDEE